MSLYEIAENLDVFRIQGITSVVNYKRVPEFEKIYIGSILDGKSISEGFKTKLSEMCESFVFQARVNIYVLSTSIKRNIS